MNPNEAPLLQVENLGVRFPVKKGVLQRTVAEVKAVDNISFKVRRGEAFGLVGESGCGKTTLARCVLRLIDANSGSVSFDGVRVSEQSGAALMSYRRRVAAVFQDPYSSLNPRMKTGQIIAEVLRVHNYPGVISERVEELLSLCGLSERFIGLYPHQMSGGQRQRVGIARALALDPDLIVCDEAVSALDVSIQAQIINLLAQLQRDLGLTYLFIGHDLSVVRHLCDSVAVMYLGKIVENANSDQLFANPLHPYTQALISAVPDPDPQFEAGRQIAPLQGEVPSPMDPPGGCVFHPRCSVAIEKCKTTAPALEELEPGQFAACFVAQDQIKLKQPSAG